MLKVVDVWFASVFLYPKICSKNDDDGEDCSKCTSYNDFYFLEIFRFLICWLIVFQWCRPHPNAGICWGWIASGNSRRADGGWSSTWRLCIWSCHRTWRLIGWISWSKDCSSCFIFRYNFTFINNRIHDIPWPTCICTPTVLPRGAFL